MCIRDRDRDLDRRMGCRRPDLRAFSRFGFPGPDRGGGAESSHRPPAGSRLGALLADSGTLMIELSNLTKRYGRFTAVDGINLTIPKGELYGLLGPNGAGKTTTMRMIAGILQPTSGTVKIAGIDIQKSPLLATSKLGFI